MFAENWFACPSRCVIEWPQVFADSVVDEHNLLSGQSGAQPSVWLSSIQPGQQEPGHGLEMRAVAPGEIICISNANNEANQSTWPKVAWLKQEATALLRDTDRLPRSQCGEEGVSVLLKQLTLIMSATNAFEESAMPDLNFSPYPVLKEQHLQRGPFIPFSPQLWPDYGGTMMQTAIISSVSTRANYHCWRKCSGDPEAGRPPSLQVANLTWCSSSCLGR